MRTDDLIARLAVGAGPVPPAGDGRRLLRVLPPTMAGTVAVVALWLGLLPPELWGSSATGLKLGYSAVLGGAGLWLLRRSGRPGTPVAAPLAFAAAMVVLALGFGAWELVATAPEVRVAHLLGASAARCPLAILLLSLPAMAGSLWASRALAPTRLHLAGAAAGLSAGGLAAMAYALACTESATAFVAVWYTLGVLLATAAGATIGPRVLRW